MQFWTKLTKITKIPQNQLKSPSTSKNHQKLMQKTFFSGSKNYAVAPRMFKSGEDVPRKACWNRESKKKKTRVANKTFVRSARRKLCALHFDDGFSSIFFAVCATKFFVGVDLYLENRGHLLDGYGRHRPYPSRWVVFPRIYSRRNRKKFQQKFTKCWKKNLKPTKKQTEF